MLEVLVRSTKVCRLGPRGFMPSLIEKGRRFPDAYTHLPNPNHPFLASFFSTTGSGRAMSDTAAEGSGSRPG